MSYDLYLGLPETPTPQPRQLGFADIDADWPPMPDPFALMINERIVEELLALDWRMAFYSVYFEELPGRMFEIGHENGLMIKLIPNRASVRLPYWYHNPAEARSAFKYIRQSAETIQRFSNYVIYDPQLEAEIDFRRDFERMLAFYTAKMTEVADNVESPWGDWPPSSTL